MKADEDARTEQLWSHQELAKGLHLSRGHLYRLLEQGHMLGPDIIVAAENQGWEPSRALRFGVDTDRLDSDFNPIGTHPAEGSLAKAAALAKTTYSVVPKIYLSSWLASYAYGLKQNAVYFMRSRGGFIPADVVVGKKYGWSEPRVIEFGEQTGRMDDAGIDRWVMRRTEEFGLSPDIAWVQQWLARKGDTARDKMTAALARADKTWRKSQEQKAAAARS